jgi:DNA-binding CsgD family transcriptional regulator
MSLAPVVFARGDASGADAATSPDFPCAYLALVIVDAQARLRLSFWNGAQGAAIKDLLCDSETTLRAELAATVCELIAHQRSSGAGSIVVLRDGGRTLRLSPMVGPDDDLWALVMEADRQAEVLARSASQYHLTRRQTEVLALILDGASAADVARALVISEYTAQGYVKALLAKTDSRNRAAMVAKVLNWKTPRAAAHNVVLEKFAVN